LVLAVVGGCISPGMPPKVPLPELPPDTQIVVRTQSRLERETQSQVDGRSCNERTGNCFTHERDVDVNVTHAYSEVRTTTGVPISLAQLEVLGDRSRNDKLARLEALERKCSRGNFYLAGLGISVGVMLAIASVSIDKTTHQISSPAAQVGVLASGAVGIGFGILGYMSQARCNDARRLYQELDVSRDQSTMVIRDRTDEIRALVESFNAGARRRD